eukprot:c5050_g1_i1 orf=1-306(-)
MHNHIAKDNCTLHRQADVSNTMRIILYIAYAEAWQTSFINYAKNIAPTVINGSGGQTSLILHSCIFTAMAFCCKLLYPCLLWWHLHLSPFSDIFVHACWKRL